MAGVVVPVIVKESKPDDTALDVRPPGPSSSGPAPGRLTLVDFDVRRGADIRYEIEEGAGSGSASVETGHLPSSAALDITVRNDGDLPVVLTSADFVVQKAEPLTTCAATGGGLSVSVAYDVRLPEKQVPYVQSHKLHFLVKQRSVDRLSFTIGPRSLGVSAEPWLYQVQLTLAQQQPRLSLPVGSALLVEPAILAEDIARDDFGVGPMEPGCRARQGRQVDELLRLEGRASPQLQMLQQRDESAPPRNPHAFVTEFFASWDAGGDREQLQQYATPSALARFTADPRSYSPSPVDRDSCTLQCSVNLNHDDLASRRVMLELARRPDNSLMIVDLR